jgi:NADH-quinone oxidoreductase subunit M
MGFIGLGLASATSAAQSGLDQFASIAISGVVFEMFGHGLIVGGLFLLIGWLGERAVERDFRTLTGVMQTAPIYIVVFAAFMFASMAMPGLVGFWGELYVLIGSFAVYRTATALSAIGIVVTAGFFVWALQRMAFGGASPSAKKLHDVGPQELWSMGPLMGLIVLFGILPHFFLSPWLGTVDILSQFLARR